MKLLTVAVFAVAAMNAQAPDPLVMYDGTRVTTGTQWREKRRPELLALFTREMYGVVPARSPKQACIVFDKGTEALDGGLEFVFTLHHVDAVKNAKLLSRKSNQFWDKEHRQARTRGSWQERVGFRPTLEFPLNTLSKRAPSTPHAISPN